MHAAVSCEDYSFRLSSLGRWKASALVFSSTLLHFPRPSSTFMLFCSVVFRNDFNYLVGNTVFLRLEKDRKKGLNDHSTLIVFVLYSFPTCSWCVWSSLLSSSTLHLLQNLTEFLHVICRRSRLRHHLDCDVCL